MKDAYSRGAFVSWQGSRYSVPWIYAGKEVWVREGDSGVEVDYCAQRIAAHAPTARKHEIVRDPEHHESQPRIGTGRAPIGTLTNSLTTCHVGLHCASGWMFEPGATSSGRLILRFDEHQRVSYAIFKADFKSQDYHTAAGSGSI